MTVSSQPTHVFRPDQLPAKNRGGGASTVPLVTGARGATSYLNGMTVFAPGAQIAHHTHNVAESVMVIAGNAIVDIDGVRTELRTFDTTFVPANIAHHFENASSTEEMRIFWTYGSLDATRTIVETGEFGRVDDEAPEGEAAAPEIVLERVLLVAREGRDAQLEAAVAQAAPLFQRARGARTFVLERSIESPNHYWLTVGWESVVDHMEGFRESPDFLRWRELISDHVEAPPEMEHLTHVLTAF